MAARYKLGPSADDRLDEIYAYTCEQWDEDQAIVYIQGLFDCFEAIAARRLPWRAIPAEFGVDGFLYRHDRHFIYWRVLDDGKIGIVTLLHERMHQLRWLREDDRT
jgi:toxin ParE1/3/4